ncbi:MAG: hypothetical protein HPY61_07955 [Methanotrichaceae archaeon]|nr:hypothetical protein [Methanotrichaceae archaeon]
MVSFKVEADARVQGSEEQERYPLVAKVKGTAKDGGLSVQISGQDSAPISAKVSGDSSSPLALSPISVEPITVTPDLKSAAEVLKIGDLVGALSKLAQGVKVEVSNQGDRPISVALGKIPVDLTISVYSPAQETAFKVEIKGTVGE